MIESGSEGFADMQAAGSVNFRFTKMDYVGAAVAVCLLAFALYLTIDSIQGGRLMENIQDSARSLFYILIVFVSIGGAGAVALWLSTRNMVSRETRVDIETMIREKMEDVAWFFTSNAKKMVGWASVSVIVTALLAVVTDNLNRGTLTFSQIIAWILGTVAVVAVVLAGLILYAAVKEVQTDTYHY